MKNNLVLPSVILGVLLAVGMIVAIAVHSHTQLVLARNEITVKGVATSDVEADYGTWNITLSVTKNDRASSLREMERQQKVISEYLAQFHDLTLKTGIPTTQEETTYKDGNKVVVGYTSSINFVVTSWKVDELFDKATSFNTFAVGNNLDIKANKTDFYYSKLDDLKISLLEEAVKDAEARAKAIGSSSKTKIGKVKQASQGVFQVNERNNFDVSSGGNFNTESKDKTVQATVDITFELL